MTQPWEYEETDFAALAEKALSRRDVLRQVEHLYCRRAMMGEFAMKLAPSAIGRGIHTHHLIWLRINFHPIQPHVFGTAESGRGAARVDTEGLTATCPHFLQV